MNHHKIASVAWIIITLGVLAGCSTRSGPPASVHYDKAASPYHIVKRGDSIASIANKYNMDKRELIRINGLESPYRIVRGQRLLVRAHLQSSQAQELDELEMPARDEVGTVPEDGDIQVKSLAPLSGFPSRAGEPGQFAQEDMTYRNGMNSDGYPGGEGARIPSQGNYEGGGFQNLNSSNSRQVDMPAEIPAAPPAAETYTWPSRGAISRDFNPSAKGKAQNDGINISAPKGSPVMAANNGVVAHAGNQLRGFGNVVLVKHDNGTMTVYAHLDKMAVKKGDVVYAGQKLGTVGQTGTIKEPQLHFEIRKGRTPLNPNQYLH